MENNQSLVSIIMSVYNSENTLEKCLDSIVNQSYKNVELLLNDDSSTDSTYNICKSYSDKYEQWQQYECLHVIPAAAVAALATCPAIECQLVVTITDVAILALNTDYFCVGPTAL